MLGSTRWVEDRLAAGLPRMVAAFLYVDSSVRALDFMADVSPGLRARSTRFSATSIDPVSGRSVLSSRGHAAARLQRRHGAVPGTAAAFRRRSSGYGRRTYAHVPHRIRRSAPR